MMQTERKRMNNYKILTEFVDKGLICVKIENGTHKNLTSCVNSLRQSIRRYHLNHIVVMQRGGEVYLFNKIRIGTLQD